MLNLQRLRSGFRYRKNFLTRALSTAASDPVEPEDSKAVDSWALDEDKGRAPWGKWEKREDGYFWKPRVVKDKYTPKERAESDKSLLAELDRLHLRKQLKVGMKFITMDGDVITVLDKKDKKGPKFEDLKPLTDSSDYGFLNHTVKPFDPKKDKVPVPHQYSYFDHEFVRDAIYPAHQFVDDAHPDFDPLIDPYVKYTDKDDDDMNLTHDDFDDWVMVSINQDWIRQFCGTQYEEKIQNWIDDRESFFEIWQSEYVNLLLGNEKGMDRKKLKEKFWYNFEMDRMPPPLPEGAELPENTYISKDGGFLMDTFGGDEERTLGWCIGDDPHVVSKTEIMFEDAAARRLLLSNKSVTFPDGTVVHNIPSYAEFVTKAEHLAHKEHTKLQWTYLANLYETSQSEFYTRYPEMFEQLQGHESQVNDGYAPGDDELQLDLDKYDDEEIPYEEAIGWRHRGDDHPYLDEEMEGRLKYRPYFDNVHGSVDSIILKKGEEIGETGEVVPKVNVNDDDLPLPLEGENVKDDYIQVEVERFRKELENEEKELWKEHYDVFDPRNFDQDSSSAEEDNSKIKKAKGPEGSDDDNNDDNSESTQTESEGLKYENMLRREEEKDFYRSGYTRDGVFELSDYYQEKMGAEKYQKLSEEEKKDIFNMELEQYDRHVSEDLVNEDQSWPIFQPSDYTASIGPLMEKYKDKIGGNAPDLNLKIASFATPTYPKQGYLPIPHTADKLKEEGVSTEYFDPFNKTMLKGDSFYEPENALHFGAQPVFLTAAEHAFIYQEEVLLGNPDVRPFRRDHETYNHIHNEVIRDFVKSGNLAPPVLDMELDTAHLMDQINTDHGDRGWFGRLDMDNSGYEDIPFEDKLIPEKGANAVKSPMVHESERDDIFALYSADPFKWNSINLSRHFGRSRERIEAILVTKANEKEKKKNGMYGEDLAKIMDQIWAGEFMYTNPGAYRNEGGFKNTAFVDEGEEESSVLEGKMRQLFKMDPKKTKKHDPPRRGTTLSEKPVRNVVGGSDLKQKKFPLIVKDITPRGSRGNRFAKKIGNPTLIRDEEGALRAANPIEKAGRSWMHRRARITSKGDYNISRKDPLFDSLQEREKRKQMLRDAMNCSKNIAK